MVSWKLGRRGSRILIPQGRIQIHRLPDQFKHMEDMIFTPAYKK
jgi:hypothetical protein